MRHETLILTALASFCFVFAVSKALFSFLGWLFPESDAKYRNHLDSIFDQLDSYNLFGLAHSYFNRISFNIRKLFENKYRVYLIIIAVSFFINASTALASLAFVVGAQFYLSTRLEGLYSFWTSFMKLPVDKIFGSITVAGFLGSFFDMISVFITIALIRRASRAKKLKSIFLHINVDVVVAVISLMWAYYIFTLIYGWVYEDVLQIFHTFGINPRPHIAGTPGGTLTKTPELWYVIIFYGISTTVPTIIYLSILIILLILRFIPDSFQRFLNKIVFLLTTDDRPILKQLSNFCSSAGGLFAAIITWIKFKP